MKSLFTLVLWIGGALLTLAAPDSMPAPSNVPGADYPRIHADLCVSFRLKAPNRKQVKLEGGAGLAKEPLELVRGEEGVWAVTTAPCVPGFHYYWFVVDGLKVNDASSYTYFGYGRETSGIEVPEEGADFYAARQEVPRG